MTTAEQRLWRSLVAIGIFVVAVNSLLLLVPWQHRGIGFMAGTLGGSFGAFFQVSHRREAFRSLSIVRRLAFILAAIAIVALAVVIVNWGAPDALLLDASCLAGIIVVFPILFMLYQGFSKAMDALWLLFIRR